MYRSSKPSNQMSSSTSKSKVQDPDVLSIILPMINCMKVEAKSASTITSYARSIERLVRFHDLLHPREMELDQVMDFLAHLQDVKRIIWSTTNKLYVAGLKPPTKREYYTIKNKLYKKEWVVYAKEAFGGPDQVLEYLGRYTHKICISNYRIIKIDDTHITFKYTDRKTNKVKFKTIYQWYF